MRASAVVGTMWLITRVTPATLAWLALTTAFAAAADPRENLALQRPATASSVEDDNPGSGCGHGECTADKAVDGDVDQRWASAMTDNQWWQVDLGRTRQVDAVEVLWERAYATRYRVETSVDGSTFSVAADRTLELDAAQAATVTLSRRLGDRLEFAARPAQFVRITAISRATPWGFSIWEVGVFGPGDPPPSDGGAGDGDGDGEGGAPVIAPPFGSETGPPSPVQERPESRSLVPLAPAPIVRIKGFITGNGATIQLLSVRAPRRTVIRTRCRGESCPDKVRTRRRVRHARLVELERPLLKGTVIEIFITKPGTWGRYTRFKIRGRRAPKRSEACVKAGTRRAVACPAPGA